MLALDYQQSFRVLQHKVKCWNKSSLLALEELGHKLAGCLNTPTVAGRPILPVVASSLDAAVPQKEEGASFFVSEKLKISEDLPSQAYKCMLGGDNMGGNVNIADFPTVNFDND